ncbi:hypothetical protein NDU88_004136 [Pleurodeles waltl]|uniref:Uncharacterized protein n=1 Tax=Pleurodeles waltl TaxID=8319 RepID=A0AAV7VJF4_PLEWA|nr:hypothetical protein NDU88_004136 [Pleurodeles waltl]
MDWSKNGGDTFYSLTEDSEAISSGSNQSEDEESISSGLESLSSAAGPTVKLQQRRRRRIKLQCHSIGGTDCPERSVATLKWDYSGIRLSSLEKDSKYIPLPKADTGENSTSEHINNTASTETNMLQLIYGTIRELQTELRTESLRARMTTKELQVTVRKVAKSCGEIEEKLNTMENRTSVVEAEVEVLKEQVETQGGQLTDIMWKLEDYENRQKRNNL